MVVYNNAVVVLKLRCSFPVMNIHFSVKVLTGFSLYNFGLWGIGRHVLKVCSRIMREAVGIIKHSQNLNREDEYKPRFHLFSFKPST
jgi:hypothetical protein